MNNIKSNKTREIIIKRYDPKWKDDFKLISNIILKKIQNYIISIEHVGSTSVKNLDAKPIIDIDIIIKDETTKDTVLKLLDTLGYEHLGDLGIKGREAFYKASSSVPYNEDNIKDFPPHNLYLCIEGNESLENHLKFRDFLKTHSKARDEYSKLKKELSIKFKYDIDNYCEGKSDFISHCLSQTGFSKESLEDIKNQNKIKKPAL